MLRRRLTASRVPLVGLALTLLVLEAAPSARAVTPPAPLCSPGGGESSSVRLDGSVNSAATYDLTDLQAMPHTSVVDSFFPSGKRKFTGVSLADLLGLPNDHGLGTVVKPGLPGPQAPAAQKNDLTRYAVMVTGTDCVQALFSAAELSPYWAKPAQAPILAFAQGNEASADEVTGPLGGDGSAGFARMIIPTDAKGSRRVSNVAGITVLAAPRDASEIGGTSQIPVCGAGGPSESLSVDGWVNSPESFDLTDLQAKPHTSVVDPFFAAGQRRFTGVSLNDLLGFPTTAPSTNNNNGLGSVLAADVPGPQAPAEQKNDLTRFSVMITGSDCFQALFSAAEFSRFWANPAQAPILAFAQGDEAGTGEVAGPLNGDGSSAPAPPASASTRSDASSSIPAARVDDAEGPSGFVRMIIPTDAKGSRRVSNVVEVRVLRPPTPEIAWTPSALTYGSPLGADQLAATATLAGDPIAGTFSYAPPAGSILPAGEQSLVGFFTPAAGTSATVARAVAPVSVAQAAATLEAFPLTASAMRPKARLTRTDTHAPIAGQMVVFVVGGLPACAATTGDDGIARCATVVTDQSGFTAKFEDAADYLPATAVGTFKK